MSYAEALALKKKTKTEDDDGEGPYNLVEKRRRPQTRFTGRQGTAKVGPDSRFRAAETRRPLFIYNVHPEANESDVATYIHNKTGIKVVPERIMNTDTNKEYGSFKIMAPMSKMSVFFDKAVWPDGIFFRRYIIFKKREQPPISALTK